MKNLAFGLVLGLVMGLSACGDDDGDSTPVTDGAAGSGGNADGGAGKTDTGGSAADGGGSVGMCKGSTFGTLNRTQLGTKVQSADKCSSTADLDAICTSDPGAIVRACGQSCYLANPSGGDAALVMCTNDCVNKQVKLSAECLGCYDASFACTANKCALPCAQNPSSNECLSCQTTNGCLPNFFTCSGLPAPGGASSGADGGAGAGDAASK